MIIVSILFVLFIISFSIYNNNLVIINNNNNNNNNTFNISSEITMITKAYVILLRHGHRAQAKNIIGTINNDTNTWLKLLPSDKTLKELNNKFPINYHPNNNPPKDYLSKPYGCLTNKGMDYLKEIGEITSNKFPLLKSINRKNIKVFSTNYERTQVSVQMLLSGLLTNDISKNHPININVQNIIECPMSFYEENILLANKYFSEVQSSPEFVELEKDPLIIEAKMKMISYFPLLSTEKGFDWLAAFDYYTCRKAHSLEIINELEKYDELICDHMSMRYQLYYKHKKHLGAVVSPLLQGLYNALNNNNDNNKELSLSVFSGHDVTLLSLLHSLSANCLNNTFWPYYGNTIILEAVEINQEYKINLFMNGEPLDISIRKQNNTEIEKKEIRNWISLNELEDLIKINKFNL